MIATRERAHLATYDAAWLSRQLADKPQILRSVNRRRAALGLELVEPINPPPATAADPARNGVGRRRLAADAVADVVWLLPTYGKADRVIGRDRPERIMANAFGRPDELNEAAGWHLRNGHHGHAIEFVGERLRAFPSTYGLALLWTPDMARKDHRDAVAAIESGRDAVSVEFTNAKRSTVAGVDHITAATLRHVALLLDGSKPAYRGAVAKVFRQAASTPEARERQLRATMDKARWREF